MISLLLKHPNFLIAFYQFGKLTKETGSPHRAVVNPVVVATTGFAKDDALPFEVFFMQPLLGIGKVLLQS